MEADAAEFIVNGHVAAGLDLLAYAQAVADPAEQSVIEAHLVECGPCESVVEELRATLLLLEIARVDDASDVMPAVPGDSSVVER